MSNRILWILLLVWVLWFGYLFYLVFFVTYTWTLEINSNIESYSVKLYAKKIAQTYNYECTTKKCSLNEISPFDYNVTISSPTYKDYISEINIRWKTTNSLDVNLIKDTKLSYVDTKIEETSTWTISQEQINTKVDELQLKKWTNYFVALDNLGYFYSKLNWNNLDFYRNVNWLEIKLWKFPKVSDDLIEVMQVFWNEKMILIKLWDDKYLYNLESSKVDNFKLVPKLKYIKAWDNFDNYLLVTDVWVFKISATDRIPKYFYLFKDFVYSSWSYIWVIYKDEKEKFNNFSLKNNNKNVIIKYNSYDLQRKVILETELDISKIVNEWESIYFYDNVWKKYKLENY